MKLFTIVSLILFTVSAFAQTNTKKSIELEKKQIEELEKQLTQKKEALKKIESNKEDELKRIEIKKRPY